MINKLRTWWGSKDVEYRVRVYTAGAWIAAIINLAIAIARLKGRL